MRFINTLIYSSRIDIRILRHVVFWVADIINYLVVVSINTEINATEVYRILFRIPLVMLATYFILYYLLPRLTKEYNKGTLFLWVIAIVAFLGIGIRYYKYYILFPLIDPGQKIDFDIWDFRRVVLEILNGMVVISMAIAIKVIKNKIRLEQEKEQLIQEKKSAELSFLKAQMHPHFLFNTLNTLYSETLHDSRKAEQVVLHLSDLLRFILDECNRPLIALEKEIKVVRDYIELEKLRHGPRLEVNLSAPAPDPGLLISPLLLLPFIENSFKHSLNTIRGQIHINIEIGFKNKTLTLLVENDSDSLVKQMNGHVPGKGIANVKRQLELLYGKDYDLAISDDDNRYRVSLLIPLKPGS